jgi:hypothetical protein
MTSEAKLSPRRKYVTRRMIIAVVVVGFLALPARCTWRMYGGNLPSLNDLRNGMAKAQVRAIVGSPSFLGERPDGTSTWVITRSGSLYWVDLDFDAEGRLQLFRTDSF